MIVVDEARCLIVPVLKVKYSLSLSLSLSVAHTHTHLQSGSLISEYLDNPGGDLQKTIAKIGIDVLLDMVRHHHYIIKS